MAPTTPENGLGSKTQEFVDHLWARLMADPRFRGPVMGMNYQSDVPDGKRPYWKILVSIPRALDMEIRAYSEKFFFIRRWGAGEGTFVIRSQEDLEKLLADPTGYWPS